MWDIYISLSVTGEETMRIDAGKSLGETLDKFSKEIEARNKELNEYVTRLEKVNKQYSPPPAAGCLLPIILLIVIIAIL